MFAFALADRDIAADPSLVIKNTKVQTLPPDPLELEEVERRVVRIWHRFGTEIRESRVTL